MGVQDSNIFSFVFSGGKLRPRGIRQLFHSCRIKTVVQRGTVLYPKAIDLEIPVIVCLWL